VGEINPIWHFTGTIKQRSCEGTDESCEGGGGEEAVSRRGGGGLGFRVMRILRVRDKMKGFKLEDRDGEVLGSWKSNNQFKKGVKY